MPRMERFATAIQQQNPPHAERSDGNFANGDVEWNSRFRFLSTFVREPLKIGAVWPSSRKLSRLIVDCCDFKPHDTVVELGAGTGPFTGLLLKRLNLRGRLLAVELNAANAATLRRRFPHCEVIHDSAENLTDHLNGRKASCIVSGLAWGNMLPRTQNRIFRAVLKSLAPGGQFVAFAYLHAAWLPTSLQFRRRLTRHFHRVETTPIVWRNLPPAFVFRCWFK
jgi:phosphatidylethanolamine/phosphatidyl-N-methylethanolamine N-methyltransferase